MVLATCGLLSAQALPAPSTSWSGPIRTEHRFEHLASGSKLWVKNRNGSIKVTGWDKEEVDLVAEIRDTERRRIELVIQHKGPDLDLEAVFQQPAWSLGFGFVASPRCEMTLNVPHRILAHFRTTNGGVFAVNLDGFAHCETTNGDIQVRDIAGEVLAETTNGSIEATRLHARIKGDTTNGHIRLEDVEGGVTMETTNGAIKARNLDGWGEGIRLETTNGSIEVELGKAMGELTAENTNGTLDIALGNRKVESSHISKHSASLVIPGRTQKIHLETTNGAIRVR